MTLDIIRYFYNYLIILTNLKRRQLANINYESLNQFKELTFISETIKNIYEFKIFYLVNCQSISIFYSLKFNSLTNVYFEQTLNLI